MKKKNLEKVEIEQPKYKSQKTKYKFKYVDGSHENFIKNNVKYPQTIKVGDLVTDYLGDKGIVVKIEKGYDDEDHGTIFVWQMDKYGYGADNCEHYCEFNWKNSLRVINE